MELVYIAASIMIGLGALGIWIALDFRGDAKVFPITMASALMAACALKMILTGRAPDQDREPPAPLQWKRLMIWMALALALLLLIEPLGAYVAILGFMLATLLLLADMRAGGAAVLALLFTAALFVLFEILLEVPTPAGLLGGIIR